MARERMVTRTITKVEYEVLCMDITTVETSMETFTLTGDIIDDKEKAIKMLRKQYETEFLKLVAVNTVNVVEELFGMSEIEFLLHATRLDSETRKPL